MNRMISFPLREVGGAKWCSVANMGVKRIDVVAYDIRIAQQHTFAGGHRHRLAVCRDDVHILFPSDEASVNIQDVMPVSSPGQAKRKHHKGR
jgi:hypothetical protein